MDRRVVLFPLSLTFASALGAADALAASRSVQAVVPQGMYAQSDNPACGVAGPLSQLSDPRVVRAVGDAVGPKAAGVVFMIGRGSEIMDSAGGAVAPWIRSLYGGRDWASCADMCVASTVGARLTNIEWSDRTGQLSHIAENAWDRGVANISQGDWSGWRNFRVFQNESGQWVVCATGTNWSHDQSAVKRIKITYE